MLFWAQDPLFKYDFRTIQKLCFWGSRKTSLCLSEHAKCGLLTLAHKWNNDSILWKGILSLLVPKMVI